MYTHTHAPAAAGAASICGQLFQKLQSGEIGPGPREIRTFKGHFEVTIGNGSGI